MRRSDGNLGDSRNYRIQVSDFGPIRRADVEFRPLTVFLGPSNTGKSYFATLSYAVHRCFAATGNPYWHLFGRRAGTGASEHDWDEETVTDLESWLSALAEDREHPRLSKRVIEMVRIEIEKADRVASSLRGEIIRSFGSDGTRELIRQPGTGRAKIGLTSNGSSDLGGLSYRVRMVGDEVEIEGEILGASYPLPCGASPILSSLRMRDMGLEFLRHAELEESGSAGSRRGRAAIARHVLEWLVESVRQGLVAPLAQRAHYLPADRAGIMHSHKLVVSALVQSAASARLRRAPEVPKLPGVVTDFLEGLIRMENRSGSGRVRGIGSGVASQFERNILGGTVRVHWSETNYPQFFYRPEGWTSDLVLMRSSSTVSELAPLVLYLRHVVRSGDVLIIEEPESHLHPAEQVEVINLLAKVVSAGIRVVVTTHSEWVLNGLANIVQASRISGKCSAADVGAPALSKQDVGAWRFSSDIASKGVVVEEVSIDGDGMYPLGFDEVATDLHNRWAEIESSAGEST